MLGKISQGRRLNVNDHFQLFTTNPVSQDCFMALKGKQNYLLPRLCIMKVTSVVLECNDENLLADCCDFDNTYGNYYACEYDCGNQIH